MKNIIIIFVNYILIYVDSLFLLGVWQDTYPTRRDTRLGSRERDETRFVDFFNSLLFNWKTQNAKKNVGAFWNQLILYEIKLLFVMNYIL